MLAEVLHLDKPLTANLIAQDETGPVKLFKHLVDAAIIVWQHLGPDSLRTVFQAACSICQAPQASK